ncbi:MAG: cobalamin-dependent protein [Nitrospira sp.]|nr:cobalamin-dependent protein [Nitrospira sp.]
MKVCLLYPTWTGSYGLFAHFARRASTWPPLNLALLAAVAEAAGHEVSIIDGEAEQLSLDEMVRATLAKKPDLIGLTATSPFFHLSKAVAEAIKQTAPNIPIAIGGPHITIMKEKAMFPAFDYAFIGEAEQSFPQFLAQYEQGKDIGDVAGLIYRRNGTLVSTGQPADIADLDQFPVPARHLLNMSLYKLGTLRGRLPFTSIQTMRGCPWKCIFCASEALKTTSVRVRSPRSVVAEIKSVVEQFGIRHFGIVDDVLTLWREHIVEICDRLDQEGLAITFEGSTRANQVDETLIARLAKSGLIRLSFGLETVDADMRKTMKKQVPLEHYVRANRICNEFGVEALNSVMIGLPGETRDTVRATLQFLRSAREVKQANFAIAVPYPGTEFHEMAVSGTNGLELRTDDFSEYRRYGSAVTTVGDLSPEDLIDLQNEGFVSIYSAPWRWKPMLRKHGFVGGSLMLFRVAKLVMGKLFRRNIPSSANLVSLGDGGFAAVDGPALPAGLAGGGAASPGAGSIPLLQIGRRQAAPAGHFGDPRSPNG